MNKTGWIPTNILIKFNIPVNTYNARPDYGSGSGPLRGPLLPELLHGLTQKSCSTDLCCSSSVSVVCGFTCFNSFEDRETFLLCENMLAFGSFAWAIRWDFDHAWDRAVWFIGFCG